METRTTSLRQRATAIHTPAHGKSDFCLKSVKTQYFSKTAEEIPPQLVLPAEVRIKKGNAARHTNQCSR